MAPDTPERFAAITEMVACLVSHVSWPAFDRVYLVLLAIYS